MIEYGRYFASWQETDTVEQMIAPVEMRRVRLAVLDGLLTEFEEVNPDPFASHVPMDVRRRLDEHGIGGAQQARQSPQRAAHGGAAEACQVGPPAAEVLGGGRGGE